MVLFVFFSCLSLLTFPARFVQDLWAIENKTFDRMKDRFHNQTRNVNTTMAEWVPTGRSLTDEEKKMKGMTAEVQVTVGMSTFTKRQILHTKCHKVRTKRRQLRTKIMSIGCIFNSVQCTIIQEHTRATLGGKQFRTLLSQERYKMDNACVMMRYVARETGAVVIGYFVSNTLRFVKIVLCFVIICCFVCVYHVYRFGAF
jgi:hypothetical protein